MMKSCKSLIQNLESIVSKYETFIYFIDHLNTTVTKNLKALEQINSHKNVCIISTNSTFTREEFANNLIKNYDLAFKANQIYNSNYLVGKYIKKKYPAVKKAYYIGNESLRIELEKAGFDCTGREDSAEIVKDQRLVLVKAKERKFDAVIVGLDQKFTAYKIFMGSFAVDMGAKFISLSKSLSFEENNEILPDVGSISAGIEISTTQKCECIFDNPNDILNIINSENPLILADMKKTLILNELNLENMNKNWENLGIDICQFGKCEAEIKYAKFYSNGLNLI